MAHLPGIVDVIPAYATLALHYDALQWTDGNGALPWQHVAAAVRAIFRSPPVDVAPTLAIVEIPVDRKLVVYVREQKLVLVPGKAAPLPMSRRRPTRHRPGPLGARTSRRSDRDLSRAARQTRG